MDLKSFVEESLLQIVSGITAAQKRDGGENIAAEAHISSDKILNGGQTGQFTVVEFDVSVVAESKEGGGGIRVSSLESHDGGHRIDQNTSRVRFSVHLRLPRGAVAPPTPSLNRQYRGTDSPFV